MHYSRPPTSSLWPKVEQFCRWNGAALHHCLARLNCNEFFLRTATWVIKRPPKMIYAFSWVPISRVIFYWYLYYKINGFRVTVEEGENDSNDVKLASVIIRWHWQLRHNCFLICNLLRSKSRFSLLWNVRLKHGSWDGIWWCIMRIHELVKLLSSSQAYCSTLLYV